MPPGSISTADAQARKRAPRYFSNWVFALSLVAGLALGIAITRIQGPLQRGNAEPWQLRDEQRHHYMMAIALEYQASGDAVRALHKLIALQPAQDPLQELADGACALGSRGYLGSSSGIAAVRSAVDLYRTYGREGCAERLLPEVGADAVPKTDPLPAADYTRPTPLPTKKPLPEGGESARIIRIIPTVPVQRRFEARTVRSFCDPARPALIEVQVVDYLGRGLPGQRIRVRWGDRHDSFLSGLKVDRGDAYADFQMTEGIDYAIDMPGASAALDASLSTGICYINNRQTLKSYRVTFVET